MSMCVKFFLNACLFGYIYKYFIILNYENKFLFFYFLWRGRNNDQSGNGFLYWWPNGLPYDGDLNDVSCLLLNQILFYIFFFSQLIHSIHPFSCKHHTFQRVVVGGGNDFLENIFRFFKRCYVSIVS